jgi:hypothetical protein
LPVNACAPVLVGSVAGPLVGAWRVGQNLAPDGGRQVPGGPAELGDHAELGIELPAQLGDEVLRPLQVAYEVVAAGGVALPG